MTDQKLVRYRRSTRLAKASRETPGEVEARLAETLAQAKENLGYVRAPRTLEAYKKEWKAFLGWCTASGYSGVPPVAPETLVLYVAHLGTWRRPKGISIALAAVAWYHRTANQPCNHQHALVKNQLEALRRRYGTRPKKKKPLTVDLLVLTIASIPDDVRGVRDRALLLLCFMAGGLRRSEVVSLDVEDVQFVDKGALVLLRSSKTDQEGKGVVKAVPLGKQEGMCPVLALRRWLEASGTKSGAVFRSLDDARASRRGQRPDDRLSDHAVAEIVKDRLSAAGIEGVDVDNFSGHSIRRGFATSAAKAGQGVLELAKTVGWSDPRMAAEYVEQENLFESHAGKDLL